MRPRTRALLERAVIYLLHFIKLEKHRIEIYGVRGTESLKGVEKLIEEIREHLKEAA